MIGGPTSMNDEGRCERPSSTQIPPQQEKTPG